MQEDCLGSPFLESAFCAKKKKNMNKSVRFQVCVTSELQGVFLSNLVCEVVHIGGITYINLEEIVPIVFKLQ